MNPLTNIRNVNKMNEDEIRLGLTGTSNSWHHQYRKSAWIFVGGLSFALSEGDVICIFSQYGEVVNINLVRDATTGKSKGYAFLCYEDQRSTILAVDNLNGCTVDKRTIRVDHVDNYRMPKDRKGESGAFDEGIDLRKELKMRGCGPNVADELRELEKQKAELEALLSKEESNDDRPRSREDRGGPMGQPRRDTDYPPRRIDDEGGHQFRRDNNQGFQSRRDPDQGFQTRRNNDPGFKGRSEGSSGYQSRREDGQDFQSRRDDNGQNYIRREDASYGRRGDSSGFQGRRDDGHNYRRNQTFNNNSRGRGRFMPRGGNNRDSRPSWNSPGFSNQKPRAPFDRQHGSRGNFGFRADSGGGPRQVEHRYNGEGRVWGKDNRRSNDFAEQPQRSRMMGGGERYQDRRRRSRS